jgi:hypothetical protein
MQGHVAAHLLRQALHTHSRGPLDGVRLLQKVALEVEVVDRAESAKGVVPETEEGAVNRIGTLEGKQHRRLVHHLRDAVVDARHKQHMPILDRRDVYEDEVWRCAARGRRAVPRRRDRRRRELEEDLLHRGLAEVEFGRVEGLADAIDAELGGALLRRTALVELRNEAVHARGALQEQTANCSLFLVTL